MDIMNVTPENIEREHVCCAISDKKGETCVSSKKAWMTKCFEDGLVFKKLDARGKVLIEYIPANKAWLPIEAPGYMHINCFWVSGQFKGQGYANRLLSECIKDAKAKGKKGLTVLSAPKKMPFLSDPEYLTYKGFQKADSAPPYCELLYLPFTQDAPVPSIKPCAKTGTIDDNGIVLYYSSQCPHTAKYAPLLKAIADLRGIPMSLIQYKSYGQAQNAPSPFTTFCLFINGTFVTNEILSDKKFDKLLDSAGL